MKRNKKIIKISFLGFSKGFLPKSSFFVRMLSENYDVDIVPVKNADYVLYSLFSEDHWDVPDRCIKIFHTGEMATPDFNACDYAMGYDYLDFGDRYLRIPLYCRMPDLCEAMERNHCQSVEEKVNNRKDFCSITISNVNRHPIYKELFDELAKYKKIDSGGGWNNTIGGRVNDKLAFDSTHKFSIVCENCAIPGYLTEKLLQAYAANCIPIYWGDPQVVKIFNPKSFVNVKNYSTLEEVVDLVKKIDSDDVLYHQILQEPLYSDCFQSRAEQINEYKNFLNNIFEPPLESSMRRNRLAWGKMYINENRKMYKMFKPIKLVSKVLRGA